MKTTLYPDQNAKDNLYNNHQEKKCIYRHFPVFVKEDNFTPFRLFVVFHKVIISFFAKNSIGGRLNGR